LKAIGSYSSNGCELQETFASSGYRWPFAFYLALCGLLQQKNTFLLSLEID